MSETEPDYAEKLNKLELEYFLLKQESEQKLNEKKEVKHMLFEDISKNMWHIRTPTEKYHFYMKYFKQFSSTSNLMDQIGVEHLESNLLQSKYITAWQKICSLDGIIFGDEKIKVQSFMLECLNVICDEFDSSFELKLQIEPLLLESDSKVSSIVICPEGIGKPSLLDCLGFIECAEAKIYPVDFDYDGGRAIKFGRDAIREASEALDKMFRFSAVTDGRQIQFFVFTSENDNGTTSCSEIMDFFPEITEECSQGVIMLCQLISLMKKQAEIAPSTVKINETEHEIISSLHRDSQESSVSVIEFEGSVCAVKYAEETSWLKLSLRHEFEIYKTLERSNVRILKLHALSSNRMLIFKEFGINLKSWSYNLLFPEEGVASLEDKQLFLSVMRDVLEEIIKLHRFGYTHGDLNPKNIQILKEDKACLINFDCTERLEDRIPIYGGYTLFISTNFVMKAEREFPNSFLQLRIYDLDSFVYTFLNCIAPDLLHMIQRSYWFTNGLYRQDQVGKEKDLIAYRTELLHEIIQDENNTKLAQIKYHKDLFNIFVKIYLETDKSAGDDSNISSIYCKIKDILMFK